MTVTGNTRRRTDDRCSSDETKSRGSSKTGRSRSDDRYVLRRRERSAVCYDRQRIAKDLCDFAVAGLWERRRGKDRSRDQGWTQTTSRYADRLTLRPDRSSFV